VRTVVAFVLIRMVSRGRQGALVKVRHRTPTTRALRRADRVNDEPSTQSTTT
jgi:hypothetical protein